MKVLYLCFTPHHIRIANYLSKNTYKIADNHLILSSCSGINESILKKFINLNNYNKFEYIDIDLSMMRVLREGFKYINNYRQNIDLFLSTAKKYEYDKIVYFSDNPVAYQLLFNDIKEEKRKTVLMFAEEGLGMYSERNSFSFRYKLHIYFAKIINKNKNIDVFCHGKGGFEDEILLREPDLVKSKGKKITLSKEEFRAIMTSDSKKDKCISLDSAALFCPSYLVTDTIIRNKIFDEIFSVYYKNNVKLYVKLHPSEKEIETLKKMITKYNGYIIIVDKNDITAEDLLMNTNIHEIISDISSVLVNAYYLRDNINLISYYKMLVNKYKIKIEFQCSIFDNLIDQGIIKDFIPLDS